MEYLKVAEGNASPKREFRLSRARTQRTMRSNILEAIAQVSSGGVVSRTTTTDELDGVVRVKIVVKKQDLKQMLEAGRADDKISNARRSSSSVVSPTVPSLCLEQRLNIMRRRQQSRANHPKESHRRSSWRPALQSIPEEL